MLSKLVIPIIILLGSISTRDIFAQNLTPSVVEVVNQVSPAVVIITGEKTYRTYQPGRIIVKVDYRIGSGFIIDTKGYILTCNHIINEADTIKVELKSGEKYEAKILKTNSNADVSLLKITPQESLTSIKIGDSEKVRAGEPIIIMGNPLPNQLNIPTQVFKHSVTCGVIGSTERVNSANMQIFQLSLPVNFGNSGGPLLNEYGEVIGIVNSKMLTFNSYPLEGVGFALAIKEIDNLFKELISHKEREITTQSNKLPVEKNRIPLLVFLAGTALVLFFILSMRISQNRYKQYQFIKKKIYRAVYTGDYQRYSKILHQLFKNLKKENNYVHTLEALTDDLFLLSARQPWILSELKNRLEGLKTQLNNSLDVQRQIMKYQLKIKRIQKCYLHQF